MNMKKALFIAAITIVAISQAFSQEQCRFTSRYFDEINTQTEILYASPLPDGGDTPKNLYFDFYEPANDTMQYRPLVITVFGGAFVAGDRTWVDMVSYGDSLAHYGYAVASIDYRLITLSLSNISKTKVIREMYAAAQDVNSAIRYFKGNYETYRIDTTQIFLIGSSSGTISCLHSLYMDDDERPEETYASEGGLFGIGSRDDMGALNSTGDQQYLNHTSDVAGIVAEWGAVIDKNYIDEDERTPICMIHGTADQTVVIGHGTPYGDKWGGISTNIAPEMDGSAIIDSVLTSYNIQHEFHVFEDEEHVFYLGSNLISIIPEKFDTCLHITLDFLAQYNTHLDDCTGITTANEISNDNTSIFPNPASNIVNIATDKDFAFTIYNTNGIIVKQGENNKTIDISDLNDGIYFISIYGNDTSITEKIVVIR